MCECMGDENSKGLGWRFCFSISPKTVSTMFKLRAINSVPLLGVCRKDNNKQASRSHGNVQYVAMATHCCNVIGKVVYFNIRADNVKIQPEGGIVTLDTRSIVVTVFSLLMHNRQLMIECHFIEE